jgi:radical SAM superfamily enzyme YgiQ (UPF0313 family)
LFVINKSKPLAKDEKYIPDHPSLGLGYIVDFLRKNKVEVRVFDENIENNDKKLFELIETFKPDLIGLSVVSYFYNLVYDLIKKLKKNTGVPIVVGGPHVSAIRKQIFKQVDVDFAIKGEGEFTLLELLKEIKKKNPKFSKIKGLMWKKRNEIIENDDRDKIKNLNELPLPKYKDFDLKKYSSYYEKKIPILTSRGCPYNCIFCSVRLTHGRLFRARSPENVVKEIGYWYKKGYGNFLINDDCFSFDIKRAMKICDLIIKRKLKIKYQLYNGLRVDRINKELLQKMKKSGCTFIAYGCEAGNEQVLRGIKKGITLHQVRDAVKLTNEVGISNCVNFIIGHPNETYESAMDSVRFAESLPCDYINFYNLVPYPGTELFEWMKGNAKFLIPPETYLHEVGHRNISPIFETKEFPKEDRIKVLKKGFDLYEKSVMKFRFGKFTGSLLYLLSRNRFIFKIGSKIIMETKIGSNMYSWMSKSSQKTAPVKHIYYKIKAKT